MLLPLPSSTRFELLSDFLGARKVDLFVDDDGVTPNAVQWPSLSQDCAELPRVSCSNAPAGTAIRLKAANMINLTLAEATRYTTSSPTKDLFFPTKDLVKRGTGTKVPEAAGGLFAAVQPNLIDSSVDDLILGLLALHICSLLVTGV